MRTTLNLPDSLVLEAKRQALAEQTTLTSLIVDGLRVRMEHGRIPGELPVSRAQGGLRPGVDWDTLAASDVEGNSYR